MGPTKVVNENPAASTMTAKNARSSESCWKLGAKLSWIVATSNEGDAMLLVKAHRRKP